MDIETYTYDIGDERYYGHVAYVLNHIDSAEATLDDTMCKNEREQRVCDALRTLLDEHDITSRYL